MTNARIITAAMTTAALGTPLLGRSATQWRNDFAISHFGSREGVDFEVQTENKKASKPVFEVHEREVGHREFRLHLMRRNNANKLTEVETVRVGMFGKLLDRPAKKEQTTAPEVGCLVDSPEHEMELEAAVS